MDLSLHVQVAAAMEAAAPYKEELIRRGVLVVPAPVFGEQPPILCPCEHNLLPASTCSTRAAGCMTSCNLRELSNVQVLALL